MEVVSRETRSYEVEHVHQLWHLDFHECSRAVLLPSGVWKKPRMLGLLDDHSRLGEPAEHDPPTLHAARRLAAAVRRLRAELRRYRHAVLEPPTEVDESGF